MNCEKKNSIKREWFNTLKKNPCKDCGKQYPPECIDFDHLYDKKTIFSIYADIFQKEYIKRNRKV